MSASAKAKPGLAAPVGAVADAFAAYPARPRKRLLQLRSLLLRTASNLDGVGPIEECLRWGEPSYLTTQTNSGTMLRLHWKPALTARVGLYVHCQTNLIGEFKARYPEFDFEGNRGLLVPIAGRLSRVAIADCMALALTYRLRD